MALNLHKLVFTLLFLSTILSFPAKTASQECPYPCYPPPTGPENNPPLAITPPSQGSYPPPTTDNPPFQGSYPPPTINNPPIGYYPFNPPPYVYGVAQPPPDPILPWFPYYYRKPPHQTDQSLSLALQASTTMMISVVSLVILFLFR